MSNEDTMEYYGFRAAYAGKFKEWQELTSSLNRANPKRPTGEGAEEAYNTIMGSGKV